jgi:hypothetical protein
MNHQPILVEETSDAKASDRFRARDEQARGNSAWLQAHWPDLLPQARGKFLVVAGQEAFVAQTMEAAWARAAHPEDEGALGQYVRPEKGPRVYANRRGMVVMR